jgi:hypothetical protein
VVGAIHLRQDKNSLSSKILFQVTLPGTAVGTCKVCVHMWYALFSIIEGNALGV